MSVILESDNLVSVIDDCLDTVISILEVRSRPIYFKLTSYMIVRPLIAQFRAD